MTSRKPVIAIDGYSSTGKSSISKIIAKELGLIHMDTGALYRAITLYALQNCAGEDGTINTVAMLNSLPHIKLEFKPVNEVLQLFLNGNNVKKEIRSPLVSANVSFVAKQPEVRQYLLKMQQEMAEGGGIIMDGRDIGTVVLPNADYKFFLTASVDERTKRRYAELYTAGEITDKASVRQNLIDRDKMDSERAVSPLRQAEDAILIDNTHLDKLQTVALILSYIK